MKKILIPSLCLIFLITTIIFGIYFMNNFGKTIYYTFSGSSENIYVEGYAVILGEHNSISITKFDTVKEEKIPLNKINMELTSNSKLINRYASEFDEAVYLDEYLESIISSDDEIFSGENTKYNYRLENNLLLDITFVSEDIPHHETISLNVEKIVNNKFFK